MQTLGLDLLMIEKKDRWIYNLKSPHIEPTLRLLQQTDVIQLTHGGKRLRSVLQLTAEVQVSHPVPAQVQQFKYNTV